MSDRPSGRDDALWNSLASFGIDEVFVLPQWLQEPGGEERSGSGTGSDGGGRRPAKESMEALRERVGDCRACRLEAGRTRLVFGAGDPASGVLFIGEAPGANEDLTGEPFVGRAGKLLDRIMEAIGLNRTNTYITNTVKCRPPDNRNPSSDETAACRWILEEQIAVMEPGVIIALGAQAARSITGSREGIGKLRGRIHRFGDIPVIATYHPAALLRTDALKRPVWEDMKVLKGLMRELGLPRTER